MNLLDSVEKKLVGRGCQEESEALSGVMPFVTSSLLVVRPGAPSSVLAPSSDARSP